MAYVAPIGSTKLVDAATVTNGSYSAVASVALKTQRQVAFFVSCDQAFDFDCGTAGQYTSPAGELDKDRSQSSTANAAVSVYNTVCFLVWPNAKAGQCWARVKNVSGSASATVSIWAVQL